jgi:hypothetical protein
MPPQLCRTPIPESAAARNPASAKAANLDHMTIVCYWFAIGQFSAIGGEAKWGVPVRSGPQGIGVLQARGEKANMIKSLALALVLISPLEVRASPAALLCTGTSDFLSSVRKSDDPRGRDKVVANQVRPRVRVLITACRRLALRGIMRKR